MESLCFISKSWNFVTFQKVQIIYNAVTSEIARLLCILLVIFIRTRMENSDKIQNFTSWKIDHNDFLKVRFFCTYILCIFVIFWFCTLRICIFCRLCRIWKIMKMTPYCIFYWIIFLYGFVFNDKSVFCFFKV